MSPPCVVDGVLLGPDVQIPLRGGDKAARLARQVRGVQARVARALLVPPGRALARRRVACGPFRTVQSSMVIGSLFVLAAFGARGACRPPSLWSTTPPSFGRLRPSSLASRCFLIHCGARGASFRTALPAFAGMAAGCGTSPAGRALRGRARKSDALEEIGAGVLVRLHVAERLLHGHDYEALGERPWVRVGPPDALVSGRPRRGGGAGIGGGERGVVELYGLDPCELGVDPSVPGPWGGGAVPAFFAPARPLGGVGLPLLEPGLLLPACALLLFLGDFFAFVNA